MQDSEFNNIAPSALPTGLPTRAVARITENITVILGVVVILVIFGAFVLSFIGKQIDPAIIAMGSVSLGFLGNAIQKNAE